MLDIISQASEPSGSEGEDFYNIFLHISMVRTLARGHLGHKDLHLNKHGKRPLGNATYLTSKHLNQVILKKTIFEYISLHFYSLNLCPLGAEPC